VGVLKFTLNEVSKSGDDICLKKNGFSKFSEAGLLELGESGGDIGDEGGGCRSLAVWIEEVAKISLRMLVIDYLVREGKS